MSGQRTAEFPYWHPTKTDPYKRAPAVQRAQSLVFNRRRLRECLRECVEALRLGSAREFRYARDRAEFRARRVADLMAQRT